MNQSMKKGFALLAVGTLTLTALAADAFKGYRCENECPLAKSANEHRAYGTEAIRVSSALHADLSASVERNLAKI